MRSGGNNNNGGGYTAGGTDHSQQDAAWASLTDLVIDGADDTKVTSSATPFAADDVGNILHITAGTGFTPGWYEVTDVTTTVATLDRACGTVGSTSGTAALGGALAVFADAWMEQLVAGNKIWLSGGGNDPGDTYSPAELSVEKDGTSLLPIVIEGYASTRGDDPKGSTRPTVAMGANVFMIDQHWQTLYIIFTTTEASGIRTDNFCLQKFCKITNSSGTAARYGGYSFGGATRYLDCEFVSTNGWATYVNTSGNIFETCYFHDSDVGVRIATAKFGVHFNQCCFDTCATAVVFGTSIVDCSWINCTLYGANTGIGFSLSTSYACVFKNNIIEDFTTGATATSNYKNNDWDYNNFHSNGTNRTNVTAGDNDTTHDPDFEGAAGGDFRLKTGSSCLTAGCPITLGVGASVTTHQGAVPPVAGGGGGCFVAAGVGRLGVQEV